MVQFISREHVVIATIDLFLFSSFFFVLYLSEQTQRVVRDKGETWNFNCQKPREQVKIPPAATFVLLFGLRGTEVGSDPT